MILSFHPLYEADENILCAGRDPGEDELAAIKSAGAVILPQGCRESLYTMARENCNYVFPNYDKRFEFPDKVGQAHLFEQQDVPHPLTKTFMSVSAFIEKCGDPPCLSERQYPLVFKFDWGGEGENVFLIQSASDLQKILKTAKSYEKTGQYGFVLQEFIPCHERSLRVVAIHRRFISYWRMQKNKEAFYTNLTKGATIDTQSDPRQQETAVSAASAFCRKTKINLAGFDFLFSEESLGKGIINPLFLEINYFFGRKGLGGSDAYYQILQQEIDNWVLTI